MLGGLPFSTYAPRGGWVGGVKPPHFHCISYVKRGWVGPDSMWNSVRTKWKAPRGTKHVNTRPSPGTIFRIEAYEYISHAPGLLSRFVSFDQWPKRPWRYLTRDFSAHYQQVGKRKLVGMRGG